MAKFCPECGNPINDNLALFCQKCGTKLPITSLDMEHPEKSKKVEPKNEDLSATHKLHDFLGITENKETKQRNLRFGIDVIDNFLNSIEKGAKSPPKKRSTLEWIAIGCGGFILLIIVLAFIAGLAGNLSSASLATDKVYNQDLSSMALTINDLPTGWETHGTTINTNDHYDSEFIQIVGLTPYVVYQDITRNVTIDDAKTSYLLKKGGITQFKIETVNLGNEGFGYVNTDSSIVVFRVGNIIVTTQYGIGGFGASFSSLSISNAQQYAAIIEERIQS